tara:strand:+ start:763 stop:915 length:153 start_codon:yes stop_codon:yes gene_type:complete
LKNEREEIEEIKSFTKEPVPIDDGFPCPICGKNFENKISLGQHKRWHQEQ